MPRASRICNGNIVFKLAWKGRPCFQERQPQSTSVFCKLRGLWVGPRGNCLLHPPISVFARLLTISSFYLSSSFPFQSNGALQQASKRAAARGSFVKASGLAQSYVVARRSAVTVPVMSVYQKMAKLYSTSACDAQKGETAVEARNRLEAVT